MNQINIQIVNQGIKDESKVRNKQVDEEDTDINVNPYQKAISNASPKDENKIEQKINWSIFSNKMRYVDSCTEYDTKIDYKTIRRKETIENYLVP